MTWWFECFATIKLTCFSSVVLFSGCSLKTSFSYQAFGVSEQGTDVFSDAELCVMVFSRLLDGGEERLLSPVVNGEIRLVQLQAVQH